MTAQQDAAQLLLFQRSTLITNRHQKGINSNNITIIIPPFLLNAPLAKAGTGRSY